MGFRKRLKKTNALSKTNMTLFRVFGEYHRRAWTLGREHLASQKLSAFVTACTMGVVLSLPGLLLCLLETAESLEDEVGPSFTITAFAVPDLSFEETVQFSEEWAKDERIQKIEVVGKAKAFDEFKESLGLTDRSNHLGNPFPHVVFFTLAGHRVEVKDATDLKAKIENNPSISNVVSDALWLNQSRNAVKLLKIFILVLSVLLLLGAILVITQSTGSLVSRRQQEIRIQELIGATTNHIRRPFLYSGTMLGLGAGFTALLVIYVVLLLIETPLLQLASSSDLETLSIYPGSKTILGILALSSLSGWAGSWIGSTLGIKRTKSDI
jgi:cell division transport system permease protein